MARIAGVDLQDNWRIDYALTRIRGIGWPLSRKILADLKVPSEKRFSEITAEELTKISSKLEDYVIEGDLARKIRADIARLITIGSYRGTRHTKNLPSRGQRTRTNARTKRGKRKTVGAFKKEILNKMEANKTEAKK
jgi:small subunit ribosomal protein S13